MKYNRMTGKLSSKPRRRSPAPQRVARRRVIVPYGIELHNGRRVA